MPMNRWLDPIMAVRYLCRSQRWLVACASWPKWLPRVVWHVATPCSRPLCYDLHDGDVIGNWKVDARFLLTHLDPYLPFIHLEKERSK